MKENKYKRINQILDWWKKRTYPQKGFILGLIVAILGDISILNATKSFSIILLPFYIFVNIISIIYELIFGFQEEFGALDKTMILSLIIYPLLGYLIGLIITKFKRTSK